MLISRAGVVDCTPSRKHPTVYRHTDLLPMLIYLRLLSVFSVQQWLPPGQVR